MRTPRDGESSNGGRRVSRFAWRLEREWRALELPDDNRRAVVAVSGGPDSTALLLALHELRRTERLKLNLIAAHLDHGLRGNAGRADAEWLRQLTNERGITFVAERADVPALLDESPDNLEQAARRIRYDFLARVADRSDAHYVLTGHTMDDQAETVLLRLMRGSGLDGLAGMRSARSIAPQNLTLLVRPLVQKFRRSEVEDYCRNAGVEPRFDAMNADPAFSRVAVRNELLPLMTQFNPKIVETLARTARLMAADHDALEIAATAALAAALVGDESKLSVPKLQATRPGLRGRVIRRWLALNRGDLRRIGSVHVRAVESLLDGEHGGRTIELPGGGRVDRRRGILRFDRPNAQD